MARYKYLNGELVQLTTEEENAVIAKETAWANESATRKLNQIKDIRFQKLQETDWMSNSDVTMPDYIKTWRQTLRDLPQNNTTESQYDTLLATDADGYLTNNIWKQPTE